MRTGCPRCRSASSLLAVFVAAAAASVAAAAGIVSPASGNPHDDLIAFVGTESGIPQLHTVRSDGTDIRQLTDDAAPVGRPEWGADGKHLLVLTGCTDTTGRCLDSTGFALMRADGSHRVDIAGTSPTFSPDGKRLAYLDCSSSSSSASCDVFVANANGRHPRLLDTEVRHVSFVPSDLAWSSDSKRLVYVKRGDTVDEAIGVSDLHGHEQLELDTGFPPGVRPFAITPVFFPDDGTITFVADFPARLFSISIAQEVVSDRGATGSDGAHLVPSPTGTRVAVQMFTDGPGGFISVLDGELNAFDEFAREFFAPHPSSFNPVWSRDGSQIAFSFCDRRVDFPGGPCSIQTIGADGGPELVYQGPASETTDWVRGYDWSPDASRLVLSVSESGGPFRLQVVNADGSGLAPLLGGSDDQFTPAWRP